jgi:amidase
MGGETIGSIITPSTRAALYALKPTFGVQDVAGLYRMSDFYDVPGPMAKCSADVMVVSELLLGRPLSSPNMESWEGLGVAFLDPEKWNMSEAMCEQLEGSDVQMVGNALWYR